MWFLQFTALLYSTLCRLLLHLLLHLRLLHSRQVSLLYSYELIRLLPRLTYTTHTRNE